MPLPMDGRRGGSVNGFLYRQYRANLHRGYAKDKHKTTTAKGRDLHRLERALIVWPAHFYARWVQRKSRYETNTTVEDVK